jgi:hypothetical protein
MAPTREAWAAAFAAEARSDWAIYKMLADDATLPRCHALHYLQMTTEKIAKAYRCRDTGADVESVLYLHVGFAKFMSSFLLSPMIKGEYEGRDAHLQEILKSARSLAREIEKLAPAVDRRSSPENAEYPWSQGDDVVTPCQYGYPSLSLMQGTGGRAFLKILGRALSDFERIRI